MNAQTREEKLSTIKEGNQELVGKRTIRFRGRSEDMEVYEIPLTHLIYNQYNGRILSRTKTLETRFHTKWGWKLKLDRKRTSFQNIV